ncbi:MAG: phosphate propanoyltransferase [Spirochaetia bacterium]
MPETRVIIDLSNRHIHLSAEDLVALFGPGYSLTRTKALLQPGQFAAAETVAIVGPKGRLEGVRILGPTRPETQCEVLASDVFKLGVTECPVKESGHLDGSLPFQVVGPAGTIAKTRGLIIAQRHIHFDPENARRFEVSDRQIVSLKVSGDRALVFENVVCRVGPAHFLECHLDFDEGNAAGIRSGTYGWIVK